MINKNELRRIRGCCEMFEPAARDVIKELVAELEQDNKFEKGVAAAVYALYVRKGEHEANRLSQAMGYTSLDALAVAAGSPHFQAFLHRKKQPKLRGSAYPAYGEEADA